MISDAYVLVTCDRPGCHQTVEISLPFTYPDYSGKNGRYDHRPEAVLPRLKQEGWIIDDGRIGTDINDDEMKHYCSEDCADDSNFSE